MDVRSYFSPSSSASAPTVSSDSEEDSSSESLRLSSPKRLCSKPSATVRRYNRKWEKGFPWLESDENYQGVFRKVSRKSESQCIGHKAIS